MTMNQFVLTIWIMSFAMLIGILKTDPTHDLHHPDTAELMIVWMFSASSIAIFAIGLIDLLTS